MSEVLSAFSEGEFLQTTFFTYSFLFGNSFLQQKNEFPKFFDPNPIVPPELTSFMHFLARKN